MTEIFGTLGPACTERDVLEHMFRAGLTGMRLNLSHTGLADSGELIKNFHNAAKQAGVEPQLLMDMQGPELRVGKLDGALELREGSRVLLIGENGKAGKDEVSSPILGMSEIRDGDQAVLCDKGADCWDEQPGVVSIPVPSAVFTVLESGDEVLLNDGKIVLQVLSLQIQDNEGSNPYAEARVIRDGVLSSHKSVKIIGKEVQMPVLTPHDISNIRLAAAYGVTGLMQPFVRSGADLAYVRKVLRAQHAEDVQIWAKVENRAAVANLERILPEADVIVIARGDLGNDMELWELPAVQKDIEQACKRAGKPFVVVTQMLASMEEHSVPTRAEVSDIFNAVADGAWGVMITGESAVGKYPVEAVKYLANTARSAEEWLENRKKACVAGKEINMKGIAEIDKNFAGQRYSE